MCLFFNQLILPSLVCRASSQRRSRAATLPRRTTRQSSGRRCRSSSCTSASRPRRSWSPTTRAAAGRAGCLGRASSTSASTTCPSTPSCWGRKVLCGRRPLQTTEPARFQPPLARLRLVTAHKMSFFPSPLSQICDSLGGGDAAGAGLRRPHDRSHPSGHAPAPAGVLHVPQHGRGLPGHRSAG